MANVLDSIIETSGSIENGKHEPIVVADSARLSVGQTLITMARLEAQLRTAMEAFQTLPGINSDRAATEALREIQKNLESASKNVARLLGGNQ